MNEPAIQLAHGGGGRLSRDLIRDEIVSRFGAGPLQGLPDAARLPAAGADIVFTTDSYVVQPVEFPGGNIGHLAVHGTVNDIAVCGGRPLWLSLGLILEEGLPLATLRRVLNSIQSAATECGVTVATGDTKVVGRGQCDSLFINTAGIGEALPGFALGLAALRDGDRVLVSGTIAEHGMAVLACRSGIAIRNGPVSDTCPVHRLVLAAQEFAGAVRFMRDPTRGGMAAVLNETVEDRHVGIVLEEERIPLSAGVRAVSDMLGLDPLHVASEGRLVMICAPEAAEPLLRKWRAMPEGRDAACIGEVSAKAPAWSATSGSRVIMRTVAGGHRLVDVPRGELLPRIC
jgi:hydrogenase expression/formation protein HypE